MDGEDWLEAVMKPKPQEVEEEGADGPAAASAKVDGSYESRWSGARGAASGVGSILGFDKPAPARAADSTGAGVQDDVGMADIGRQVISTADVGIVDVGMAGVGADDAGVNPGVINAGSVDTTVVDDASLEGGIMQDVSNVDVSKSPVATAVDLPLEEAGGMAVSALKD